MWNTGVLGIIFDATNISTLKVDACRLCIERRDETFQSTCHKVGCTLYRRHLRAVLPQFSLQGDGIRIRGAMRYEELID